MLRSLMVWSMGGRESRFVHGDLIWDLAKRRGECARTKVFAYRG